VCLYERPGGQRGATEGGAVAEGRGGGGPEQMQCARGQLKRRPEAWLRPESGPRSLAGPLLGAVLDVCLCMCTRVCVCVCVCKCISMYIYILERM
jgi:hypothetical protein